jgi:hypothetical protein
MCTFLAISKKSQIGRGARACRGGADRPHGAAE